MSNVLSADKRLIRNAFANASAHYDDFAHLQRSAANTLMDLIKREPLTGRILDIGCGTGFLTQQLQLLGGYQQLIALDIAQPMLQKARQRTSEPVSFVCGDAEFLPFQTGGVDGVFSSLALQWCQHLPAAIEGFRRILKPGGRLAFATFGSQTLIELKKAWATVDHYRHVNDFCTPSELQTLFLTNEWQLVHIDNQVYRPGYGSVATLLHELKGLGAKSVTAGRKRQLTGKAQMQKMFDAYPRGNDNGGITASFEIIWVVAEAVR